MLYKQAVQNRESVCLALHNAVLLQLKVRQNRKHFVAIHNINYKPGNHNSNYIITVTPVA
jgi:hypothetical protein